MVLPVKLVTLRSRFVFAERLYRTVMPSSEEDVTRSGYPSPLMSVSCTLSLLKERLYGDPEMPAQTFSMLKKVNPKVTEALADSL